MDPLAIKLVKVRNKSTTPTGERQLEITEFKDFSLLPYWFHGAEPFFRSRDSQEFPKKFSRKRKFITLFARIVQRQITPVHITRSYFSMIFPNMILSLMPRSS
jgi:hypothetical protein